MKNIFALISILASGSAFAIDDAEVIQKLGPAWVSLEEKAVKLVGPDYHRLIVDAAFANVASSACPGVTLNGEETDKRFNQMVAEKGGNTPEEQRTFIIKATTLYGTYLGLLLSESYLDTPVFCKHVEHAQANKQHPNPFWKIK